jgi:predicted PurR-regulated permease PerM
MRIKQVIITVIIYSILFASIVLVLYKYIPIIVFQTKSVIEEINELAFKSKESNSVIGKYIVMVFDRVDFKAYSDFGISTTFRFARNIGAWSAYVFIALLLSMFFILEKHKVVKFFGKFKHSRLGGIYNYIVFFGSNFLNSFGKVIQAQIVIAFVSSIFSVLALWIMGFPQLMALCAMIFVLSLIPVAGVIISLVPLILIAYKIGGAVKIIYVLVMIFILHAITSYIIYPKLMSSKTEMPIFLTFVILIISEHFMGVWGLLIGIPLFIFMLDLLGVDTSEETE